ncbi:MAG TPA: HAD-IIB family hydrolase [Sorangium sp.]|nr:HAD-IIB family hydrolase [Sorangium sp.]
MYKLLALDLDGTLVRRGGEVSQRDRRAIKRLRERGVVVTIATGRLYPGATRVADMLGLDTSLVCADGAHICHHPSGNMVERRHIDQAAALALRDGLQQQRLATFVMGEDEVLFDDKGAMFEVYMRGWTPKVTRVTSTLTHPSWQHPAGLAGVVAIGPSDRVLAVRSSLDENTLGITYFDVNRVPGVGCLLLRAPMASKGAALTTVAAAQGVAMREVVAVGDWLNDVSMLRAAGRSFAMGHAPAVVKSSATDQLAGAAEVADAIALAWP